MNYDESLLPTLCEDYFINHKAFISIPLQRPVFQWSARHPFWTISAFHHIPTIQGTKGFPDGTWKFMAFEQKGRLKQIMFQKSTLLVFFFFPDVYIYICIIYYVLIIFMTYNICTPKDIYKNMTYICVFCGFIS